MISDEKSAINLIEDLLYMTAAMKLKDAYSLEKRLWPT